VFQWRRQRSISTSALRSEQKIVPASRSLACCRLDGHKNKIFQSTRSKLNALHQMQGTHIQRKLGGGFNIHGARMAAGSKAHKFTVRRPSLPEL
jgi:hypothetical protein